MRDSAAGSAWQRRGMRGPPAHRLRSQALGSCPSVRSVTRSLTPVSHQKLGVRDRVGLVMYALRHGLSKAA